MTHIPDSSSLCPNPFPVEQAHMGLRDPLRGKRDPRGHKTWQWAVSTGWQATGNSVSHEPQAAATHNSTGA